MDVSSNLLSAVSDPAVMASLGALKRAKNAQSKVAMTLIDGVAEQVQQANQSHSAGVGRRLNVKV